MRAHACPVQGTLKNHLSNQNKIQVFFTGADELKTITQIHEKHKMSKIGRLVVKISLNGAVNDGQVAGNTLRAHKARPAAFSISHVNNR